METSLIQITKILENYLTSNKQVNSFRFWDDPVLVVQEGKGLLFPLVVGQLTPSSFAVNQVIINCSIYFMDQELHDGSNRNEVWSDMLRIASDLKAMLKAPENSDLFTITTGVIQPFREKFNDVVTGWSVSFTFNVYDFENYCKIPV